MFSSVCSEFLVNI